jgi:hypothetical protein
MPTIIEAEHDWFKAFFIENTEQTKAKCLLCGLNCVVGDVSLSDHIQKSNSN